MVRKIKYLLRNWLGFDLIAAENLRLARAVKALEKRLDETIERAKSEDEQIREALNGSVSMLRKEFPDLADHEVRIEFLESQLTAKTSTAKIVPKAHKATFRQFAQAASQASEPQETE
jgi:predicted Ser/Thr protein kinase